MRSRARSYLSELCRAICHEESHSSSCSLSSALNFSRLPQTSLSTATGSDKIVYPILKHLLPSGMDFLLHIFNLSWFLHSFIRSRKPLLFQSTRWKSLSTLLLPSGLSLLPPVTQSSERTILSRQLFFLSLIIAFSLPARPVFGLDGLPSIKYFIFLSPFRMDLTNP